MGNKVHKGNDSGSMYACQNCDVNWEEEKERKTDTSLLVYSSWSIHYYSLLSGYPGGVKLVFDPKIHKYM